LRRSGRSMNRKDRDRGAEMSNRRVRGLGTMLKMHNAGSKASAKQFFSKNTTKTQLIPFYRTFEKNFLAKLEAEVCQVYCLIVSSFSSLVQDVIVSNLLHHTVRVISVNISFVTALLIRVIRYHHTLYWLNLYILSSINFLR